VTGPASTASPRPPASERIRSAPATLWVWVVFALAAPPYIGVALNDRSLTEPGGWYGVGFAVLLSLGLLLRWRFAWVVAFLVDGYLLVAGLWAATEQVAAGLGLAGKSLLAWAMLLAPATRAHVFGSAEWRDEPDEL
jgi:hypothetical protein